MAEIRTVAIYAPSPALTALLGAVIASDSHLRARTFESEAALLAYLRLVPADLVVLDLDSGEATADLAQSIRCDGANSARGLHIIALAREVDGWTKHAAARAGIDEVLLKPMSPRYLLERVRARTSPPAGRVALPNGYLGPERRNRFALPPPKPFSPQRANDNVIPLFPRGTGAVRS